MQTDKHNLANFVIGGTEKAGTTSAFVYLSQHPAVCVSSRKETDFFRHEYTGDAAKDASAYGRYFDAATGAEAVFMEASPSYLGEAAVVAPRMAQMIPQGRLLFILRDPIDRIYSSYNFHVGKLNIPAEVDFDEYVRRCMAYDSGTHTATDLGLDDWYLKVLRFGRYAESLQHFYSHFANEQIKVMFFEDLKKDTHAFMAELSQFLEIDPGFWLDYEFRKTNVTFSGRNKLLHRLAMWANQLTESTLRRRPELKHRLVSLYKSLNQAREGYDPMAESVRRELLAYYQPDVNALNHMLGNAVPAAWSADIETVDQS